jgi:ABC-2 type transport system ATP-binding protein
VESGEVYGFLGPNGAGKTTTLRVLMDIIRPTSGHACVFGLDCQKNGVQIRQRVGYLPGELKLFPQMDAAAYFQMVSAVRGEQDNRARISELCQRLELEPSRPMNTYSHGNKQKVGLVTAFMSRPELLILDEPTTGLDPLVQQIVLDMVREVRDDGRTVFFSSHILSEVQKVCDRVGIIRNGQIVATEQVEKLLKRQFHRFRLRFDKMPPEGAFDNFEVRELHRHGNDLVLEIHENLNAFMSRAVTFGIIDLEEQNATLEEIFLAYYGAKEDNHHA